MDKISIEDLKIACSQALMNWALAERHGQDMTKIDEEIGDIFTSKVLLKKFDVFKIDIVLPNALLLILYFCTQGNPGQVQIILKDLLLSIKKRKGPIPKGYVITSEDFAFCFMRSFPITDIEEINNKYMKLWDEQKVLNKDRSFNLCDTPEWWLEVMQ